MADMMDLIVRGGTVVDGTGGAPFEADVAISGGRIVEVGKVAARGREEIDAKGRIVTPGFVDIHTHYDGQAIWADRLAPSSSHGVTSVVMGNCGVGFAPCRKSDHEMLVKVMEGVEDIPEVVMTEGLTWDWETFPEFLDALDRRNHDIDIATQLPHSALRVYVMGQRAADREAATKDDLAKMSKIAREAVEAGALGFATSRLYIHRTADGDFIPTYGAADHELEAIALGLKEAGRGVLQVVANFGFSDNIPGEFSVLRRLAQISGRPLSFSLGTGNSGKENWREILGLTAQANAEGLNMKAQVFGRPIGIVIGHELSANPFSLLPSYQPLAKLPLAQRLVELRRPEVRAKLLNEAPADARSPLFAFGRNFEFMFPFTDPPNYEPPLDSSVAAEATRRGVRPEELAYDLLLEKEGHAMLYVAMANYPHGTLDTALTMMRHKDSVLGLGDGGAHCGIISDGSFPTSMLAHWTRDRTVGEKLPLPWVVKAMTRDTAETVGLNDRGMLAPGYKADVNIIDYDRLKLHAPIVIHDLPAGGRRLDQRADGYDATIVSGQVVYRGGAPPGALPGRLVRGQQGLARGR